MPFTRPNEFEPGLPPAEYALPEAPGAEFLDIPKAFGAGVGEGTHSIGEGLQMNLPILNWPLRHSGSLHRGLGRRITAVIRLRGDNKHARQISNHSFCSWLCTICGFNRKRQGLRGDNRMKKHQSKNFTQRWTISVWLLRSWCA